MNNKFGSGALKRLLKDLKTAKPLLAERRLDGQKERGKPKILHLYAVDTNILYFIAQPIAKTLEQNARRKNNNRSGKAVGDEIPHIGSLFRDDPEEFHWVVASSIAQYISSGLAGPRSLFLPMALWPEVEHMVKNYSQMDPPEVSKVADKLYRKMMQRSLRVLLDRLPAMENEREQVADALRVLIQQRIGRHQGLNVLREMFTTGKIDSLDSRPVHLKKPGGPNFEDWLKTNYSEGVELVAKWDKELLKAGKVNSSLRDNDARALTQIQMRNMFAIESGSGERVLYLTADTQVIKAAMGIPLVNSFFSFSQAFIRHPSAFLNEIGLGFGTVDVGRANVNSEVASVLDWIDVLLAESSDLEDYTDDGVVTDILNRWRELSTIQGGQLSLQLGLHEIEDLIKRQIDTGETKHLVERLQEEAAKGEAQAWRRCFDIGIELALRPKSKGSVRAARSSPPICFEAWPDAAGILEQFKIWGAQGLVERESYLFAREKLEQGKEDGGTGYSFYLASAAFFAARGEWEPAAGLSAFSYSVASQFAHEESSGANGREASFFEAVARRHLAKNAAELARSRELMDRCEKIYELEEKAWEMGEMDIVSERFVLERYDIEQTEILFNWFNDKGHRYLDADSRNTADEINSEILSLFLNYVSLQNDKLAPQVNRWLSGEIRPPVLGSQGYALVQCEVRAIVSALLLLTIDELKLGGELASHTRKLLARLAFLHEKSTDFLEAKEIAPAVQDSSILASLCVAVSEVLLAEQNGTIWDLTKLTTALNTLNQENMRALKIYPFDGERIKIIESILRRNIKSHDG